MTEKWGIHNLDELKTALKETVAKTDLKKKSQDFEHLLFNKANLGKILSFGEFVEEL